MITVAMSRKFLSHNPRRRILHAAMFTAVLLVIGLSSVLFTSKVVHAGGVGGGGSGSGGGSGGYRSANGWGWAQYAVSGGGPTAYTLGTASWASIRNTCSDANSVITFVALNASKQARVYQDTGWEGKNFGEWWSTHYGPLPAHRESGGTADGGSFISSSSAQWAFNQLGAYGVSTAGYTFGRNVAWFCWDYKPQGYSLSAASMADHTSAKPGDTITWSHTLANNGPGATTQNTHSNVGMSGFSNGWGNPSVEYSPGDTPAGAGVGVIRNSFSYNIYGVQQADVGNTLCEWVQYDPVDSAGNRNGRGIPACVSIPYGYTLTPNTNVDLSGTVEANSTVNVTPTISNAGPTKSQSVQWQVTQIVVQPGAGVPNAGGGTSNVSVTPCGTYFKSLPQATCSTIASGNSVIDPSGSVLSGSALSTSSVVIGDYPVGTKVCYATSVQPYSSSTTDWRHSAPVCLIIGLKPKVQVIGGDLMANSVNTSATRKSFLGTDYTFGSWIEYGIFAVGNIYGAASGSAYSGSGLANANNCIESKLSFADSTASGVCSSTTAIGNYANSNSIPDVGASFPASGAPSIGSGDLSVQSKSGVFTTSGVTLSGGNIQQGRWVVINAPGADVTINGDITYTNGQLHSLGDIPQVVIIANNINITSNVKQIDAWLIAKSSLNTCSDVIGNLSSDLCNNQLIVNGPVAAGKLYLRRTAGSGSGPDHSGDPAEIFNLRPDAYMWASLRATGGGNRIQTVYTTELPPRL